MRYWVRKINAKGVLLLCLTTQNPWRYVFRTKRPHEPLLSQWIMHPNPTHIFSSSPHSLHKSHKFMCIFFFQKNPTKQGILNLFKYLDFRKDPCTCCYQLAKTLHLAPVGRPGVDGLSCPQHHCPGPSWLQRGAQTQARANSPLDFMMLQPGDAESCKVTSKENIRHQGRRRDLWSVPHSLFIPKATMSSPDGISKRDIFQLRVIA